MTEIHSSISNSQIVLLQEFHGIKSRFCLVLYKWFYTPKAHQILFTKHPTRTSRTPKPHLYPKIEHLQKFTFTIVTLSHTLFKLTILILQIQLCNSTYVLTFWTVYLRCYNTLYWAMLKHGDEAMVCLHLRCGWGVQRVISLNRRFPHNNVARYSALRHNVFQKRH